MSIGEVLRPAAKEFDMEDLTESESEDYIWDDKKINKAYEKAIKIAGSEVAKRLAMSTNSKPPDNTGIKPKKPITPRNSSKIDCKTWKAGMVCRALYRGDDLEYEAVVLRIINSEECVVRFLGYENSEIVPINTLKPSLGKEQQAKQVDEAHVENNQPGSSTAELQNKKSNDNNIPYRTSSGEKTLDHKTNPIQKKMQNKRSNSNLFEIPKMPYMPNISMMQNMGSIEMPMPPPPPLINISQDKSDSEEQAISSMLLSWYMSGYYTGLYQGMKRAKEKRNR